MKSGCKCSINLNKEDKLHSLVKVSVWKFVYIQVHSVI